MTHPKDRLLTCAEYETKAMLIPRASYFPNSHVIAVYDGSGANAPLTFLDPDTLEAVSSETRAKNFQASTTDPATKDAIRRWEKGKPWEKS